MKNEYAVHDMDSLASMMKWLAGRLKISINALCATSGTQNTSLTGFITGSKPSADLNAGPLLRVLQGVSYHLVTRPKDGALGVPLESDGALSLMVVGAGGRRIEVPWSSLADIRQLLRTLALARGVRVTTLAKQANLNSLSLVSVASGSSPNRDVRFGGIFKVVEAAGFETVCRPLYDNHKTAQVALASSWRS